MTPPRRPRPRAGITLTEILISILIMGVGMLSLATLFPLGLTRLRDAARNSRSALLIETATGEISSRDLLYKPSFLPVNRTANYPVFDPFTLDPTGLTAFPGNTGLNRQSYGSGTGLMICYDPLWWHEVNRDLGIAPTINPGSLPGSEYRFASGIGQITRPDPDGGTASAHGLQRITNFPLGTNRVDPFSVCGSPDDMVLQTDGTAQAAAGRGSPIVPDLSTTDANGNPILMRDYAYTWLFTGKQTDVSNGTVFDGDVVIFHNRPFGTEQVAGVNRAVGETVVEAVWGYSSVADPTNTPYSAADRKVLLRWPSTQADPDVRVGGWIADVTYERTAATEASRWYSAAWSTYYPAQRCHWYRVAKKAEATTDPSVANYRQMVVTLGSPVKAKTPINAGGTPQHLNAALVSPYVVNVVSRVFYTR